MIKALHILVVLGCMLLSSIAHAGSLTYRGGEIEYKSGYMDPETFNGKIRDVVFHLNTGDIAYADYLHIRTTPLEYPERLRIDTFEVQNFTFENTDGIIALSSMDWSGLELRGTSPNIAKIINGETFEDDILLFGDVLLEGLFMDFQDEGIVTVNRLDLSTLQVPLGVLENLPLQEGTLVIDQLVISPASASSEFARELADLGLERLVIDARMESAFDQMADRVNTLTDTDITIEGLGTARLMIDIGFLNSTLQMLDAVLRSPDMSSSEQMGALILSGGLFNKAEITITDTGFLPLAFSSYREQSGSGRDEAVAEIMEQLAMTAGLYAPRSYTLFAPAIEDFLHKGGTISFSMRPSGPTPFSSFLGFAAAPDTAVTLLGTDIRHYP
ncbi:hypothetical protein AB8880_05885 [Alphaproteobacteria bacterium LSUCC0684]